MNKKLAILILGKQASGKSTCWKTLFNAEDLRTGSLPRKLPIGDEDVDVFLINGSPQERKKSIEECLKNTSPDIVLCSVQYSAESRETINYLVNNGYDISVFWLNPGHSDEFAYFDNEGLAPFLLSKGADLRMRGADTCLDKVVSEIRGRILAWRFISLNGILKRTTKTSP